MWRVDKKLFYQHSNFPLYSFYHVFAGQGLNTMHVGLFRFSLQNMADEEQWKKFFIPARDFDIWGCYAQTELGHGSNV